MDKDVFEVKWKKIQGQAKVLRDVITTNSIEPIASKLDSLADVLQEEYDYTHPRSIKQMSKHKPEE